MSRFRRSLTVVAVSSLGLSLLSMGASAEEADASTSTTATKPRESNAAPDLARGLVVMTTTSTPGDGLLAATDIAVGSDASVAGDQRITGKISTIEFDQTVGSDVAAEAAATIERRPDVVWAVPDTLRRFTANPPVSTNDPLFKSQRNLWDTKLTFPSGGYSIKAPTLWRATKGSADVRVAVLDTGILKNHPDLDGQLIAGRDFVGEDDPDASVPSYFNANDRDGWDADPSDPGDWAGKNQCYRGQAAYPSSWHGTFVAGQVAAKSDNEIGIAGVAPDVKIQPVRVLGRCGGWDSDIIAGITWASGGSVAGVPTNEAPSQVINMSLNGYYEKRAGRDAACKMYNPVISSARSRGSLVVAAVGNDFGRADLSVPASCNGVVSVGATSTKGYRAAYSNSGSNVDIAAPGGDSLIEGPTDKILSLGDKGTKGPSAPTYVRYEGTSMATPQVAAGAALIYGVLAERGPVTPSQLETALLGTVSPPHASTDAYRYKIVNIDGDRYRFNLNCSSYLCGRGILDLSKVPIPLTPPTLSADPVIGEPLTVKQGQWNGATPLARTEWNISGYGSSVGGVPYYPTRYDIGRTISATVRPANEGYSVLSTTTAESAPVQDGPTVELTSFYRHFSYELVQVRFTVKNGAVGVSGPVEIRRDLDDVLATGYVTDGEGVVLIPENKWRGDRNSVRVAFLGNGTEGASSSDRKTYVHEKVASKVALTLASSVRHTSRATLKIRVTGLNATSTAGAVTVYDGTKVIARISTPAGGLRTYTLPKLAKGRHTIKAQFRGNKQLKLSVASKSIRSY